MSFYWHKHTRCALVSCMCYPQGSELSWDESGLQLINWHNCVDERLCCVCVCACVCVCVCVHYKKCPAEADVSAFCSHVACSFTLQRERSARGESSLTPTSLRNGMWINWETMTEDWWDDYGWRNIIPVWHQSHSLSFCHCLWLL